MPNDNDNDPVSRGMDDSQGADEVVTPRDGQHQDQYPHYTHELADEDLEGSSRALIRFVPLAYGLLLGGLVDNMLIGLVGGAMISTAFDLFMGANSLVRSGARGAFPYLCPALAAMARGLAKAIKRLRLTAPFLLSELRCKATRL